MAELARIVGAALVAGLVLGCTGSAAGHPETKDQPPHQVVTCLGVIDAIPELVPGYTAYGSGGGFVALPSEVLQLGRSGSEVSGHEDYRFAKFGLLVRRSRQATLEIVRAPDDAFLDYGQIEFGSASALTVGPCDTHGPLCEADSAGNTSGWPCGADRGEWLVWAGGISVNEPGCVEVLASSGDEEISVWLAAGASCDGRA
ncbi:hypothetical protein [Candidatus Poriferisodalis sp.]|uniref:hypothetical protein n=1 Tax=Candidatus Poriferisodalis sp. TaxID=3101277 RepID=UPI003B02A1E4